MAPELMKLLVGIVVVGMATCVMVLLMIDPAVTLATIGFFVASYLVGHALFALGVVE